MPTHIDFIPNSTMTPSIYYDAVMPLCSPVEWKVMSYLIRRTYGFRKASDRVSLSQICDGIVNAAGEHIDYGTDVSVPAARKALDVLTRYGLVKPLRPNNKKNQGREWGVQMDSGKVLWDELWERFWQRKSRNKKLWGKKRALSSANAPIEAQAVVEGGVTALHTTEGYNAVTGGMQRRYRGHATPLQHNRERNRERNREAGGVDAPLAADEAQVNFAMAAAEAEMAALTTEEAWALLESVSTKAAGEFETESAETVAAPKPKSKRATKLKTDLPVQLNAFVRVWGKHPRKEQRALILAAVGDDADSLARWETAMRAWLGRGYNYLNIDGQIEWYQHGVPRRVLGNGNATVHRISGKMRPRKQMTRSEFEALQNARNGKGMQ